MMKMSTAAVLLASLGFASAALAQTGSVKIVAPTDGATLDASKPVEVSYEVVQGPKVDHIHLYVDGKQSAILREAMGTHTIKSLPAGSHELCIKAVTKSHVPTGIEQCNKVTVK